MTEFRNYDSVSDVAQAAAENLVEILRDVIEREGTATWVLAGGSSPVSAYKYLIKHLADELDWGAVTVLMGDERFVPLTDKESNWGGIMKLFDADTRFDGMTRIAPDILETVEKTARAYEAKIAALGIDRFDLVWLGVGEDGHTLSLFPGNPGFTEATDHRVIAVHDSPKPPLQRISFSLTALEHVVEVVIFATGASKRESLRLARLKGRLPVAVAAAVAESNGAEVRWLYDDAAWGEK